MPARKAEFVINMTRPKYCPCENQIDPCPACGATIEGNDPVRGVCQATHGIEPSSLFELVEIVLIDKYTNIQI